MSEQELLNACKDYIRWKGYYCQRVPSGLIKQTIDGEERWIHLADKGTPDILACIAGKFVGIEVKANEAAKKRWHASVKKSKELKPLKKCDETAVALYFFGLVVYNYKHLIASMENVEIIKVPFPDEFKDMSEKEMYDFLIKHHNGFMREVGSICLRGSIPKYARASVENDLAQKAGFMNYMGIWLSPINVTKVPEIFKKVIKQYGQSKPIITEKGKEPIGEKV